MIKQKSNKTYFECDFVPIAGVFVWLFEFEGNLISREIGLDENKKVIYRLPDPEFPRGLFGDSPISFNIQDLKPIESPEFENLWKSL